MRSDFGIIINLYNTYAHEYDDSNRVIGGGAQTSEENTALVTKSGAWKKNNTVVGGCRKGDCNAVVGGSQGPGMHYTRLLLPGRAPADRHCVVQ